MISKGCAHLGVKRLITPHAPEQALGCMEQLMETTYITTLLLLACSSSGTLLETGLLVPHWVTVLIGEVLGEHPRQPGVSGPHLVGLNRSGHVGQGTQVKLEGGRVEPEGLLADRPLTLGG